MELLEPGGGVFYHQETPEKAAEPCRPLRTPTRQIEGWAFIGGWPLFTSQRTAVAAGEDQGRLG